MEFFFKYNVLAFSISISGGSFPIRLLLGFHSSLAFLASVLCVFLCKFTYLHLIIDFFMIDFYDQLIWLINWLIDDWLIDWLIDWLMDGWLGILRLETWKMDRPSLLRTKRFPSSGTVSFKHAVYLRNLKYYFDQVLTRRENRKPTRNVGLSTPCCFTDGSAGSPIL